MKTLLAAVLLTATVPFAQLAGQDSATPARAELERAFTELLSDSRLVGHYTDSDALPTSMPEAESYGIKSLVKNPDGSWRVTAVIEFARGQFPVEMQIDVDWAGDTPMMLVREKKIPLLGTYSARVLFHGDRYAGTWQGGTHGGHLFGRVVRDVDPAAPTEGEPGETQGKRETPAKRGASEGPGKGQAQDPGGSASDPQMGAMKSMPEMPAMPAMPAMPTMPTMPTMPEMPEMPETRAMPAMKAMPQMGSMGADPAGHWPSFRGPGASGMALGHATVAEWDVQSGRNVRWRTQVPGLAHSSPVVWGDNVFVTTAVKEGDAQLVVGLYGSITSVEDEGEHEFQLLCFDKNTGEQRWARTAYTGVPEVKRHPKGSHAASTPATDGRYVAAFFGSEGLYIYTVDGELVWSKDFGVLDSGFFMMKGAQWGFASSPVIHGDQVIVQCDVQDESFVAAYGLADGAERWRTARDEVPTWGTPTVDAQNGRVIVNGYKHMGAYDLETGAELWRMAGGGDIPVPTPILGHGMVYLTNAHGRMAPILAVSQSAAGELTMDAEESEHVVWSMTRRGNYMQTPILVDDLLYMCNDGGVIRCLDARTGERVFEQRLGAGGQGFSSSPVYADGKLYYTSEEGEIHVVRAGDEFESLAVNDMGETCMSTPAISEGVLIFRTRGHLVAVGAE